MTGTTADVAYDPHAGVGDLKELTRALRFDVLDMTGKYSGHVSSCFSAVEIMTALYFNGVLRYRPADPDWQGRDRFILSKGHAAPLLYAILAHAGYFEHDQLGKFRQMNSGLHGHPVQGTLPGVEMTAGSLGQGLSFGLGCLLAGKLSGLNYRSYVLLGDGECQEGQIWEAAMAASHMRAERLIAIVDHNKYQQTGPIEREMSLAPFAAKWRSFGWRVEECDGHDIAAITAVLTALQAKNGRPSVLIAHTRKGKGVTFVESDYTFHGRALTAEQDTRAREEIRCN